MAIIRTQGLRRDFGGHPAVASLDLEVAAGEIFGLVGPDGAGKTTTMRMLTGILPPTAGNAEVAGCDVGRDAEKLKGQIGYMSQRFGLYPDLTVAENIDFYADIYSVPARGRAARTEQLLGFSNLTPFRHRLAGNLSGGMKQKLGLACALIHTPRVLFLDEPTNGVDPVSRRDFWRILYQLVREGVTIFVSTAYLDEAERCNRLALLHEGRLIGLGTPNEVKALMPGSLLEVRTADPRRAAVVLRVQLPDATVGLFGDRVHVTSRAGLRPALSTPHRESTAQGQVKDLPYSEPTASLETRIRAALAAENLELHSLRPIEPSLEDVFVSAIGTPPTAP